MRLHAPIVLRALLVVVIAGWAFAISFGVGLATGTATALAAVPADEEHGVASVAQEESAGLEQRRDAPQTTFGEVGATVMCPSCDTTVDQSQAPAALRMRAYIEEAVAAGWTEEEIQNGLVAEYGGDESILAVPRRRGLGILAWAVPAVIILLAAVGGVVLMRQWRGTRGNDGQPRTAVPYSQPSPRSSSSSSSSESEPVHGTTVPSSRDSPSASAR